MKAFLDTNIFLNPLLAESECHDCLRVLNGHNQFEAVTSYLSMANIAYVLRKRAGKEKVAPTVRNLLSYISSIANSTGAEYEYACFLRGPDFEDILQFVNATLNSCTLLVTCNKYDFMKISDPDNILGAPGPEIITPAEFITRYL
ncbi:MAG: type II toxin-antitoxin system VapC family toxin [Bacteroidales bacterium]|nr:type II toxin-antitoxin system VapC family toxin [Bacteroidales bacterium]